MSQLTYNVEQPVAVPGMPYDYAMNRHVKSCVNPVVAVPFGVGVCNGVDPDRDVKLPTTKAEAEALKGVAIRDLSVAGTADQFAVNSDVPVMSKGRVWVQVEEAVTPNSPVYVRYADGIDDVSLVAKGSFRGSPDGTAQEQTLTPVVANSSNYRVALYDDLGKLLKVAQYTSDASATATEICDGLRTALGTVAGLTFSGTATLVITASSAGQAFSVDSSANLTSATGQANVQSAGRVVGAKYVTSAAADGFAVVELDL